MLLALVILALLAVSPAQAHSPAPWFGTYQVSVIGGSQDTSWTLNHVSTGECDPSSSGQGSDDQTFLPGTAKIVQFSGVGASAFPSTIASLELKYTEDREGSITETPITPANPASCSGASGEGQALTPDCGTRSLSTEIEVNPSPSSPSLTQAPAASTGTEPPYKDCPIFGLSVPAFASPLTATLPPLGPASDGGLPTGKATLDATEPITEADVTGQTTLKLELQFVRLVTVDPLGMPGDPTLNVTAVGATTVPVDCPGGGGCSGTVGLALGGEASGASVADARVALTAPSFPAPDTFSEPIVASAHFHLKAHHRGVVLHLPGGRLFARSLVSDTFDVVISQGSGKKSVRYVAGQAHLNP
jgi:hypothetical protein